MTKDIAFIIPIRHPKNATNWDNLRKNLTETIKSISNQSLKSNWKCIIVANEEADLPELPEGSDNFFIKRVNFKPNPDYASKNIEDFYDGVRKDKGLRVLAGLIEVSDYHYYMVVDDDDFISNQISNFVRSNLKSNQKGWKINKGYVWKDGSNKLYYENSFDLVCGTSSIINLECVLIPETIEEIELEYVKNMFGSHIYPTMYIEEKYGTMNSLPFEGAIYRVASGNNHSGSNHPLKITVFNKRMLKDPISMLRKLLKTSRLNDNKKEEFFGI